MLHSFRAGRGENPFAGLVEAVRHAVRHDVRFPSMNTTGMLFVNPVKQTNRSFRTFSSRRARQPASLIAGVYSLALGSAAAPGRPRIRAQQPG